MRFLIALAFISGCASTPELPKPSYIYQKDLQMEINGEKFVGLAVPDEAVTYKIKIKAKKDHDYIDFKTCGRFRSKEDEGSRAEFIYTPMDEVENDGECIADIFSGNKEGYSGWGRVVIRNSKRFGLSAYLRCDGFEGAVDGTSACQTLTGLEARIKFSDPVLTQKSGPCVLPAAPDRKEFVWKVQRGDCAYKFKKIGEDKWHVLFVTGFDRALYRDGK